MIQPISTLSPKVSLRGKKRVNGDIQANPVNTKVEKNLAILNAGGVSAVSGALITAIARSYTASWKNASLFGLGAGIMTMLFICPRFLYKSGIKAYTKEKELDVFSREKEVQKKLLADLNEAIDKHYEDLDYRIENYSKAKS